MTKPSIDADLTRIILVVLIVLTLIASTFWLLKPFMLAMIWAGTIVITLWPLVGLLQERFRLSRLMTTTLLTLCMLLIFFVPLGVAILAVVNNIDTLTTEIPAKISNLVVSPPTWVEKIPLVGERISLRWHSLAGLDRPELMAKISPYVGDVIRWLLSQIGNLGMLLLHLSLTLILAVVFLLNAETTRAGILAFGRRLAGERGEDALDLAGKSVRAVALGVIGTALIQAILAGLGLLIAGVPYVLLLSSAALLLGIIQIGSGIIMLGALIWVYYNSSIFALIGLGIWTVFVLTADNFIRPILIRRGVDLPLLLIFAGVIGGLLAFGIIGLFVGPVVLAVSYTTIKAWVKEDSPRLSSPVVEL